MKKLLASLRAALGANSFLAQVGGLTLLALALALWVGIPARRQAALLKAEAGRLERIVKASESWVAGFQPASNEETLAWQNTGFEVQKLGATPSDRLTLAQVIARRAEDVGFRGVRVNFAAGADSASQSSPRQVGGRLFRPAQYGIVVEAHGSLNQASALIGVLPNAVVVRSVTTKRSGNDVTSIFSLAVYEPAN